MANEKQTDSTELLARQGEHAPAKAPSDGLSGAPVPESMLDGLAGRVGRGSLQRRLLQRRAQQSGADAPQVDVHSLADQGTSGSGGALPHLDAIQASFGRHDVRGIEAHTGAAATRAAEGMGAEAYATGNAVAFAGNPSLHTAAHEAAHVVQQRAGVHLKGGVGEEGDAYERHADAVADRVVAGQSAESLLSQMAPAGNSTAGAAASGSVRGGVQRKGGLRGMMSGAKDRVRGLGNAAAERLDEEKEILAFTKNQSKEDLRGVGRQMGRGARAMGRAVGGAASAVGNAAARAGNAVTSAFKGPTEEEQIQAALDRLHGGGIKDVFNDNDPAVWSQKQIEDPQWALNNVMMLDNWGAGVAGSGAEQTAERIAADKTVPEKLDPRVRAYIDSMERSGHDPSYLQSQAMGALQGISANNNKTGDGGELMVRLMRDHGMTRDEILAVALYTADASYTMNAILRGQIEDPQIIAMLSPWIDLAASGLRKLPAGAVNKQGDAGKIDPSKKGKEQVLLDKVFRFDMFAGNPAFVRLFLEKYKEGASITEPAFLSTTMVAGSYGKSAPGTVMRTLNGASSAREVKHLSRSAAENEALLAPGTTLRIDKIEDKAANKAVKDVKAEYKTQEAVEDGTFAVDATVVGDGAQTAAPAQGQPDSDSDGKRVPAHAADPLATAVAAMPDKALGR